MSNAVDTIDTIRLQDFLQKNIPGFGAVESCEKFAGGQSNPTFLVKANGNKYVLRRKPPGLLLKSAHAVDREYRVMKALANTVVPVPKMLVLCEDDAVIGSMFYLMEFIEGRILWDAALPEFESTQRGAIYEAMVNTLASLHTVDLDRTGLRDYGKAGSYFVRQYTRWTDQYRASATREQPNMQRLIEWLSTNIPEDDGRVALIHGDYRLDNMMFHASEPRVVAVLDWELSTLGHPWADLAFQCMQLRMPRDFIIPGLGDIDRTQLGIPSEAEYVARYCELTGIDEIPNWNFYIAFSCFRLGAIFEGIYKRALDGNASSPKAPRYGAAVEQLAEVALQLIR